MEVTVEGDWLNGERYDDLLNMDDPLQLSL